MCLAVPVKVVEKVNFDCAVVEMSGVRKEINLGLLKDIEIGEYVILHAGFAIQRLDEKEAVATLKLLEELCSST